MSTIDPGHKDSGSMTNASFDAQLALSVNNPTIRQIAKAQAEGRLRLRPAFQRNLVWSQEQKSYLVDSILRNYPIPELYIQVGTQPGIDDDLMIVVDGQQRLAACIQFYTDKLRLSGEELDPKWNGRVYSELPDELRKRFSRYKLLVRDLPELTDAQTREIFRRLNRVVEPLLPQELRHAACSGPYIQLIETVSAHPVLQELRVFSAMDVRRRGSDELIAEIVHAFINKAFPNKKEGLDEAFRLYELNPPEPRVIADIQRRFGRVCSHLSECTTAIRRSRFRNKSDFYSLMVLLLRRAESLPLGESGARDFSRALEGLSERVATFRGMSANGGDIKAESPEDEQALKYMRAVERAASDRLNRLRRDEVLGEWLGKVLSAGQVTELGAADAAWMAEIDSGDEAAEAEVAAEREHLKSVLLEDPSK